MKKFEVQHHSMADKSFQLFAPDGWEICAEIDFDDVWHEKVDAEAKAIVKILNSHLDELKSLIAVE